MNIQTKRAKYTILGDLGILVNEELVEEFSHLIPSKIKEEDAIKVLEKEFSDTEIMESIQGCSNMALVITEECNFRCKYCIYSGKYIGERVHSNKKMSIDTARKAVDFFFRLVTMKKRNSIRKILFIAFYGGESLLEFQLVKDVIRYAERKAIKTGLNNIFDLQFRLNTNGYLLDDSVADFLMEKDVLLDISLDGPESEHNRFRVTREGRKTWGTIIENIKKMKQQYPDYYDRRVNFFATIHPLHNSHEVERFFSETPELFGDKIPRINLLNLIGLNKKEAAAYSNIKFDPGPFYSKKVYQNLNEMFKIRKRENGIGLTGTCFPGRAKLLVTPEGNLNICEKINHYAGKIGNLDEGFDFEKIRHILKEYSKGIVKNKCWDCQLWFLCDMCIGKAFEDGHFKFVCTVEQIYPQIIKDFLEKKEEEDNQEYSKSGNSIIDFIEQL